MKKNMLWMFLGNAIYAFSQWFQISTISKLSSINTLGQFTLALAIVSPVFMFSNLQLRGVQVTDSKGDWKFSDYFTLRFLSNILSVFFLLFLYIFVKIDVILLLLLCLLKCIEGISEIFNSRQQLNEQMKMVSISFILKGLSIILSTFVGLYFFDNLYFGLFLAVIINLLILFFNDYRNCKSFLEGQKIFNLDKKNIYSLFLKALPLGVVMLVLSLNTNSLKYYVEYFLGTKVQGIYSSLTYVIVLGTFVLSATAQTILPRLGKYYNENKLVEFKSIAIRFIFISILLGIISYVGSLLFSEIILKILFSNSFLEYTYLFKLIMFSTIFIYAASSLGYILTSMREFKIQPYINVSVLLCNIIFGYVFIKKFGINGLIYSSIISFILQIIFTLVIILKKVNEKKGYTHIR